MNLTRAEINPTALINNLNALKSLSSGKELIAVVKANAYGHGIETVCPCLCEQGVRFFAVSDVFEADSVRKIAPDSDILILGVIPEPFVNQAIEGDYIQTIVSVEHAKRISEHSKNIRCHIKIDTGMTRFGIDNHDELHKIMNISGLKPEAVFTHFPSADSLEPEDMTFTLNQQLKLSEFASRYNLKHHSQNSAGVLYHSDFEGDMVRAGISLYGYRSNTSLKSPVDLSPVMSLKSTVIQIKEVGVGVAVGYSKTYVTDSPRRLAVVPVGYADGYSRLHSNKGQVAVKGRLVPIRGRVCMDYIMVDISDTDGVRVGDEVEVYSDSHKEIGIEHIADSLGTIPYEVTCNLSARVPRISKG